MCKMYDVCTNAVLGESDHETVETISSVHFYLLSIVHVPVLQQSQLSDNHFLRSRIFKVSFSLVRFKKG